jgi:phage shock protein PspC (stress-responsive transcriptional regulator)
MNERLYRSRKNRVIGGVSAGLGDYLNLDPVLIRIIFVILTLFHGIGLFIYIIMWIVVPENPSEQPGQAAESSETGDAEVENPEAEKPQGSGKGRVIAGVVLIALGFIFLVERFFPYWDFEDFLPFVLIALGIFLVWNSVRNNKAKKENEN